MSNITLVLPTQEQVTRLFSDLLGRKVTAKKVPAQPLHSEAPALVAQYVYQHGGTGALIFCDLAVACHAGAALMLLPPPSAVAAVKAGQLTGTIVDNMREVLNVSANLFIHEMRAHVRLGAIFELPKELPADIAKILAKPLARIDLNVEVSGYGSGRMVVYTA